MNDMTDVRPPHRTAIPGDDRRVLSAARFAIVLLVLCVPARNGSAQAELPRGVVIDRVECMGDAAQTYALYVPSGYSPDRRWNLLLAFDPAARGPVMVAKFRAAAEQYGYIVAASNNSRNGPAAISAAAARAMATDVTRRFSVDPQRLYLTGLSGGARVALAIALGGSNIAGVIASSAGFPDSRPRSRLDFPVFSTAGTEDFNYLEMRMLDRNLRSPHFLAVFRGDHGLPPDDVAVQALEWMEIQAMQSGRRSRDETLVGRILGNRRARLAASTAPEETVYLLGAIVSDFKDLADVSGEAKRMKDLLRLREVRNALARDRRADNVEARTLGDMLRLEAQLGDGNRRRDAFVTLRDRLSKLSRRAAVVADTPDRSQAIRVLRAIVFGASSRVADREYLALLEQYRHPAR